VRAGGEILNALDEAAKGVQAASTELSRLITEFGEARICDDGEIKEGLRLRYEVAVQDELAALYTIALSDGRKPPAEDIRTALAERAVRTKHPQLYADYNACRTRIEALKLWLSNQRAVISGYQSLRRGEAA
jgi:hypothetical protein